MTEEAFPKFSSLERAARCLAEIVISWDLATLIDDEWQVLPSGSDEAIVAIVDKYLLQDACRDILDYYIPEPFDTAYASEDDDAD